MKKYEILGGNLPVVVCELSAGESMITESGSMSWMSPNMKMETISGLLFVGHVTYFAHNCSYMFRK